MSKRFNRLLKCTAAVLGLTVAVAAMAQGKTYKVAVKEQASSSMYVALIKAVVEATGNKVDVQIVPPNRAVYLVTNRMVDIQLPELRFAKKGDKPFDYSSVTIFDTAFVLYSSKEKPLDPKALQGGNTAGLKVETDPTLVDSFEFQASPSAIFESSLTKVSTQRIDGFLMSQFTGDTNLKKSGLKNIRRQVYSTYPVMIAVQKGAAGEIDKMLAEGMAKVKASGKFDQIMGGLVKGSTYTDWQP